MTDLVYSTSEEWDFPQCNRVTVGNVIQAVCLTLTAVGSLLLIKHK